MDNGMSCTLWERKTITLLRRCAAGLGHCFCWTNRRVVLLVAL